MRGRIQRTQGRAHEKDISCGMVSFSVVLRGSDDDDDRIKLNAILAFLRANLTAQTQITN
jgi:hypothetical protein